MTRRPRSIALRLALWLSLGTGLLWAGAAAISAYVMSHELNEAYDDALRQGALRLLPLALHEMRDSGLGEPRVVTSHHDDDDDDNDDEGEDEGAAGTPPRGPAALRYPESYSYVILDKAGKTVLRDEDAPEALLANGTPPAGFGQIGRERSYVLSDARSGFSIVVLEDGGKRLAALGGAISALVLPLLGLVPLIGLGIWAAMRVALRPLEQLGEDISKRHSRNLEPITLSGHPAELVPIVTEVGSLMDRLSAALAAERAFAASSAHELRTPIAGALAQTQQLAAELGNHPTAARIREIEQALRKLSRLSEKLLQLSRLEAGFARSATETDLVPVAELVVRDLSATPMGQGRIRLAGSKSVRLSACIDPDAFAVALRNLVENALHHGEEDGTVTVTLAPGEVSVSNGGPVVNADILARLGQPFERGETKASGSGLGLSITRTIMSEIGGDLRFASPAPGQDDGFMATLVFPVRD